MEFENTFDGRRPVDEVWDLLLDVERVAPCMPGAQVLEQTGDDAYKVAIKVKLGPMSMNYKGDVEIVEQGRVDAPGDDAGEGQGGARPGDGLGERPHGAARAGRRAPRRRSSPRCR